MTVTIWYNGQNQNVGQSEGEKRGVVKPWVEKTTMNKISYIVPFNIIYHFSVIPIRKGIGSVFGINQVESFKFNN